MIDTQKKKTTKTYDSNINFSVKIHPIVYQRSSDSCQTNAPIFKFENQIFRSQQMSDNRFPQSIITNKSI